MSLSTIGSLAQCIVDGDLSALIGLLDELEAQSADPWRQHQAASLKEAIGRCWATTVDYSSAFGFDLSLIRHTVRQLFLLDTHDIADVVRDIEAAKARRPSVSLSVPAGSGTFPIDHIYPLYNYGVSRTEELGSLTREAVRQARNLGRTTADFRRDDSGVTHSHNLTDRLAEMSEDERRVMDASVAASLAGYSARQIDPEPKEEQ